MAYTINLTNGAIFATIPDGTRDTSSSLVIIGKNYTGYGEFIGENFVKVLENHANTTPPLSPLTGQLWYDLNESNLKIYDSTTFKTLGVTTSSDTEPVKKVVGDMWYDTITQQIKVFDGAIYDIVGPLYTSTTGKSGPIVETLLDTGSNEHVATLNYVEGNVVSIEHKDSPFILHPGAPITGFVTTIYPGVHLTTDVAGEVPQFTGTATNSVLLNNVNSDGYLSALDPDTTAGTLGVLNNGGLTVGLNSDLQLTITGNDVFVTNTTLDGRLVLQTRTSTGLKDVITIATTNVTEARAKVDAPLDVTDIANMNYVDTTTLAIDGTRPLTGNMDAGTNKITNLADPVDPQDAATLQYVLDTILGTIYTVGSYFFGPDPSATLPGTWQQLPAGTFLMASTTGNGVVGGSNSTTLTETELPVHSHVFTGNALPSHDHSLQVLAVAHGTGENSPNAIGTEASTAGTVRTMNYPNHKANSKSAGTPSGTVWPRGNGAAWDSRPQYEEVEVWKRTA